MANKKRFISALFAMLSCFSASSYAAERKFEDSKCQLQNGSKTYNNNSKALLGFLGGGAILGSVTLAYHIYQSEKNRFEKFENAEKYVEANYIEIMKPYVHVDNGAIDWAPAYKNSSWDPEWDIEVDKFLKHELAVSKCSLYKDGIEIGNDKALFPFTVLRILGLSNVLQELRDKNHNEVYISFSDEDEAGYEIRVQDGRLANIENVLRPLYTCWARGDFARWNDLSEDPDAPEFYREVFEKCKQAFSNKFFRCFKRHFGGICIKIKKDGRFDFEVPDLNAYHDKHVFQDRITQLDLNRK